MFIKIALLYVYFRIGKRMEVLVGNFTSCLKLNRVPGGLVDEVHI